MSYVAWFVGLWISIAITVLAISKIEKSGYFDKYNDQE